MSNHIKNLINTAGWKDVEKMFNESIVELKALQPNENLSGDDYKSTDIGYKKGANHMQTLLNRIKLAGGGLKDKNISYK